MMREDTLTRGFVGLEQGEVDDPAECMVGDLLQRFPPDEFGAYGVQRR